jgi:hypothetical protein
MPGPIYVDRSPGFIGGGELSKGGPVYHAEMTLYWATGPNGEKYVAKRIRAFRDENGVSTEITP